MWLLLTSIELVVVCFFFYFKRQGVYVTAFRQQTTATTRELSEHEEDDDLSDIERESSEVRSTKKASQKTAELLSSLKATYEELVDHLTTVPVLARLDILKELDKIAPLFKQRVQPASSSGF